MLRYATAAGLVEHRAREPPVHRIPVGFYWNLVNREDATLAACYVVYSCIRCGPSSCTRSIQVLLALGGPGVGKTRALCILMDTMKRHLTLRFPGRRVVAVHLLLTFGGPVSSAPARYESCSMSSLLGWRALHSYFIGDDSVSMDGLYSWCVCTV